MFVEAAVEAGHPVSKANRLPVVLQEAVDAISSKSAFQLAKERHATLSHWVDSQSPQLLLNVVCIAIFLKRLARYLPQKRLLLWKETLMHYGYPDVATQSADGHVCTN